MDNQKNDIIADTNGQNNQINKADINILFSGDSYGLFVFTKTEKIVTAIYLLTGLMSDTEPMKEKLRSLATELLSTALLMSNRVWGEETFQKNLSSTLCEISVLFDVAETAKMISKMNHQIIANELKKLLNFLTESSSNYSSAKIAFPSTLFDGDYNYIPDQSYHIKNSDAQKTASPDTKDFSQGQNFLKDNEKNTNSEKMSVMKISVASKGIKDKNNRQDTIVAMLKGGAKLTIKDFAKNIKGVSDKTIQRELISLVAKGLLKKEGERRWSKYFLA